MKLAIGVLNSRQLALKAVRSLTWSSTVTVPRSYLSTPPQIGDQNLLLMGQPGAGKTSVGHVVAHRLGVPAIDIDDNVLEVIWKMPVADKLFEFGGKRFLEEEGKALCNFSCSGSVISLTGSNPLHSGTMHNLKRNGLVVYLDVAIDDIIQRLSQMKVNRIVGQEAGVPIRQILSYRKQFYEKWLDIRVVCGTGDTIEEIAEKVLQAVKRYHKSESELFVSTRSDQESSIDSKYFSDVVVEGLAPDGGLYVPKQGLPKLDIREWLRLADMSYPERASVILEKCIHPMDIPSTDLRRMVFQAYGGNFASNAIAPVKHLIHNQFVQELFHGPTASFKDLSLQLMPQLFAYCLPHMCNYLIVVATSGDTGSAVLSGFGSLNDLDRQRVGVLVFFPEEGVSEVQKLQMTGYSECNTKAVSVQSDFDFCQRAIKRMFRHSGLTRHLAVEYGTVLSTANSINWARLLPQVRWSNTPQHIWICLKMGLSSLEIPLKVCIPTGNFGNALSALYAKQMGIPIRKIICASNHNRIISDFITSGECDLRNRPLIASHSPAIDILKSSNLERFLYHVSDSNGHIIRDLYTHLDRDQYFRVSESLLQSIQIDVLVGWCSEADCLASIQSVHTKTGYVMDTHTAVAKTVADQLQDPWCPVVICSTAHYAKFAPAILNALQWPKIDNISDPLEQLRVLGSLTSTPQLHQNILQFLTENNRRVPRVCQANFNVLVEEVESMIEDSFFNVS